MDGVDYFYQDSFIKKVRERYGQDTEIWLGQDNEMNLCYYINNISTNLKIGHDNRICRRDGVVLTERNIINNMPQILEINLLLRTIITKLDNIHDALKK